MSRRSETSPSTDLIRDCLDRGLTGSVRRVSADGTWMVFVMQGEILAAHGPRDGQEVVRLLLNGGAIAPRQAERLLADLGEGRQLEGLLLGRVPEDLFLDLLSQRFRQNLLDFMRADGPVDFKPLDAVFVENIQTGHDSRELLAELAQLSFQIAPLLDRADDLRVVADRAPPASAAMARLQDLCEQPVSLAELLVSSPYEPGATLAMVLEMSASGSLRVDGLAPPAAPADEPELLVDDSEDSLTSMELVDLDQASLQPLSDSAAGASVLRPELADEDEALNTIPPVDQDEVPFVEDQTEEAPLASRPPQARPPADLRPFSERLSAPVPVPEPVPEPEPDTATDPAMDLAIQQGLADRQRRAAAAQFQETLDDGVAVRPPGFDFELPDDQLAFFSDQDQVRGGGEGTFVSDTDLLDRVDLSDEGMAAFQRALQLVSPAPVDDEDEALAMGEASEDEARNAVALSFGGPKLDDRDISRKFDVVNDVLVHIAAVVDRENGPGSGRLQLQLLVDGPPTRFAVLFRGVQVDESGRMDVARLLKNLKKRPETEHRRIVNESLMDLIQRVLSTCVDELPEDSVDEMLEKIAGYQHRLGY